jgi:hypothetical protein
LSGSQRLSLIHYLSHLTQGKSQKVQAQMPGAQASCLHERVSANNNAALLQHVKVIKTLFAFFKRSCRQDACAPGLDALVF